MGTLVGVLGLVCGKPSTPLRLPSPASGGGARTLCGLRGGARKPLWRGSVISKEAIQAVQALKLAKSNHSPDRLEAAFRSRVGRLLKDDLLDVLAELRRQNEWQIALQVFALIRKEVWYKPDLSLYSDMILLFGKNKLIENAEKVFSEIEKEGLQPDTRAYTEMIGTFLQVGQVEKAMNTYESMKESGCNPDKLTLTILIRNLEKSGAEELASSVRKESAEYIDFPAKFFKEVSKKYSKRKFPRLPELREGSASSRNERYERRER